VVDLAKASWEEFLPYYAGLGYYRRGRNMLKTAQTVVQDFEGEFPRDKKQLMSLPGIGEYTASAILTFAYGENHLAFDTNLQKVFGRFLHGNKRANVNRDEMEKKLTTNKGVLSAAIMDFANQQCLSKPKCTDCPLKSQCEYAKTDGRLEASPRSIKNTFPIKDAVVFLWLHKDHTEYYSPHADGFEVFRLPLGVRSRDEVKQYFREHYKLELAVRPPHKKTFVDGKPVLFVNAQILLGEHGFAVFGKDEI
jgi:A/G-specific adenine glycosylase